jgi:ubiquinone/menaquinone biosynthesis C-methylase UbiE
VDLRQGEATGLDLPSGSFDTVVCTYTLCCVADPGRALAEMVRVLRPGGSLLLADHVVADRWWLRAVQAALELVSVPVQGEHFRRRPLSLLPGLGLDVVEVVRSGKGVLERVHARLPR